MTTSCATYRLGLPVNILDQIGIFFAFATACGFLYELRFHDATVIKLHRALILRLRAMRKGGLENLFYSAVLISSNFFGTIYGPRRRSTYLIGFVSARSWKASSTLALTYCVIAPICVTAIAMSITQLYEDADEKLFSSTASILVISYTLLCILVLVIYAFVLIECDKQIHTETKHLLIFFAFTPFNIFFALAIISSQFYTPYGYNTLFGYLFHQIPYSFLNIYIVCFLSTIIITIWIAPYTAPIAPLIAHIPSILLIFLSLSSDAHFNNSSSFDATHFIIRPIIVMLMVAILITPIAVTFYSDFARRVRLYNLLIILNYLGIVSILTIVASIVWEWVAIFLTIWGAFYVFITINGLAYTISVAIISVISFVTFFALTTYIPTIINLSVIITYPTWRLFSYISYFILLNIQMMLTSPKKIFGLRASTFAISCLMSGIFLTTINVFLE